MKDADLMHGFHHPSILRTAPPAFTLVKWLVYVAVAFAVWLAFNFQTLRDYLSSQGSLRQSRVEVERLEKEYSQLLDQRRQLEIGGFQTEKAIRERLKMVRPGERVIYFEDGQVDPASPFPLDPSAELPGPRRITLADLAATTPTVENEPTPPKGKKMRFKVDRSGKSR